MSSRSFTVFQDAPTSGALKVKPAIPTTIATRSSSRLNQSLQSPSPLANVLPIDKENVHPVTGERAGATSLSKKRKTNVLAVKPTASSATKKIKPSKEQDDTTPAAKKRKATSATTTKSKTRTTQKDGKQGGSLRKTTTKRLTRKVSQLPRLEEESEAKGQEAERIKQATIDSRCYELTVQPLADVSQAYDVFEPSQDASPASKVKFRKVTVAHPCSVSHVVLTLTSPQDASAEPEIRDFFPSSQTLVPSSSATTVHATPTDPAGARKFSTPERKQIYAAFTFSSPSPTSERLGKVSSRSGSIAPLHLV